MSGQAGSRRGMPRRSTTTRSGSAILRAGGATVFVDGVRVRRRPIDFARVNAAALPRLHELCARWLPGGKVQGHEWRCGDLRGAPGRSCSVNLRTGKWADFAAGVSGGDIISLAAAIHSISQSEAARRIADMLGIDIGEGHA